MHKGFSSETHLNCISFVYRAIYESISDHICPSHLSFSGILKVSEQHKSAVASLHSLENRPYGFFVHSWVDGS
jgi:hypothetical protein